MHYFIKRMKIECQIKEASWKVLWLSPKKEKKVWWALKVNATYIHLKMDALWFKSKFWFFVLSSSVLFFFFSHQWHWLFEGELQHPCSHLIRVIQPSMLSFAKIPDEINNKNRLNRGWILEICTAGGQTSRILLVMFWPLDCQGFLEWSFCFAFYIGPIDIWAGVSRVTTFPCRDIATCSIRQK